MFGELVNIFRQVSGKQNIFGYKTTSANQLYLMYCFLGKIHTTNKLHFGTKCIWLMFHYLPPVVGYALTVVWMAAYVLDDIKPDFLTFLYTLFIVSLATVLCFCMPVCSYWFRIDIEKMIYQLDNIVAKKRSKFYTERPRIHIRNMIIKDFLLFWIPMTVYSLVCCFDVMLFFENEKLYNILYYPLPFPYIHELGSTRIFFISYFFFTFVAFPVCVESYSQLEFFKLWAALCYNEVMSICDNLSNVSESAAYQTTLVKCIDAFQQIDRTIEHTKRYFELISSVLIPATALFQIVHAYVFLSEELPYAVIGKEISVFVATCFLVYSLCSVGEIFDALTEALSNEIYFTPWYNLSPYHRKNIQMFLYQAQKSIHTRAFNVYPLNMNSFMRFNNAVYSSVNFLRNAIKRS